MFKIVRFPSRLEPFFDSLRDKFHWDHFEYFRLLVLLMSFAWGRHNIAALCRYLDAPKFSHRSRFNNFVLLERWDPAKALAEKALELLVELNLHAGDTLKLIIDDSKKEKRGGRHKKDGDSGAEKKGRRKGKKKRSTKREAKTSKTMEAVGWIHDPVSGRNIRGHQYVTAVIEFRGMTIPFGVRLYVKKEACRNVGVEFKKTTQLAADLITAFDPPPGVKVLVECDSYYLCPTVVGACRQKGFFFVSTLKSNRNLFKNGRKLKAGKYGKSVFQGKKRKGAVIVTRGAKTTRYQYRDIGWLKVAKLGDVHLVYSRRQGDRNILALVTDDPKLSASDIIRSYAARWRIEVFFKDTKQLLGLGQYQNGTYRAAVTHLHLVCFAYALLTHVAIEGARAKGKKKKRKSTASPSTAELQNELRRLVWDDLSKYLSELPDGTTLIKELRRLLVAA
jgi:hypothetical protein